MPATARPNCAIVIPARFASSRFPGKPLADILGKPMIRHVWERCVEALGREHVYVATDDARIREACEGFDARVLMTSSTCLTGTDRVAEAARALDYEFLINVQGDEPMLDPADILAVAHAWRRHGGAVDRQGHRAHRDPRASGAPGRRAEHRRGARAWHRAAHRHSRTVKRRFSASA